ncbi:MAG: glutathione S-transferase [Gammaproteobacteria bacterium]
MTYELYYWPGIPGRGEFVRLALEEAGADYVDVAKDSGGEGAAIEKLQAFMNDAGLVHPPFAPPVLKAGDLVIAQTANILLFLGPRHGLAPADEAGRLWAHQLQLTLVDWVVEIHDTHHPLGGSFYYDEQKEAAARRSERFIAQRIPKFMGYFETVLERNPAGAHYLVGDALSCADLSLFLIVDGLRYAFPRAMKKAERKYPKLIALHDRVAGQERIAAYLASDRRLPFSEDGIFRHYAELDS